MYQEILACIRAESWQRGTPRDWVLHTMSRVICSLKLFIPIFYIAQFSFDENIGHAPSCPN